MSHKYGRSGTRARVLISTAAVVIVVTSGGIWTTVQAAVPARTAAARVIGTPSWTTRTLAPGVQVRSATIRNAAAKPVWTVTVQAPTTGRLSGAATWASVGAKTWAETTEKRLRAGGFKPRVEAVRWPGYADTPHGVMGLRVRVGSYATQADAQTAGKAVAAAGFHPAVDWTGYDGDQPADRENVHVAVIDPHTFTGIVEGTHAGNVAQRVTTSSVAGKLHSLIGVNAGFFVTSDADGVQGTQAGISADHGQLQSMATGARAALIIGDGGRHVRVTDLTTTVTVVAGAARFRAQGINRVPGLVRDCGRPGGTPSARPWQDVTCRLKNDLVQFTDQWRAPLPTGAGRQVVLNGSGRVVSVGSRGGAVPVGGAVLQGVGSAARWLTANVLTGERVRVQQAIRDADGRLVRLGRDDSIVSAAPTLVRNGRNSIDAAAEGVLDPSDLSFGYAWANVRQPRTLAGVDAGGRLILVTVDGRLSGGSEGFTLQEAAAFMRSLGAVNALNLDGGGSTAMAVRGVLVNRPSDAAGERAVGGTIQVLARKAR